MPGRAPRYALAFATDQWLRGDPRNQTLKWKGLKLKFDYHQPTELLFGRGRVKELDDVARRFGKRVLLVTGQESPAVSSQFAMVKSILTEAGLEFAHFDGVIPNPTVESIAAGSRMAPELGAHSVIGLGGGSSMDSAKAIAVEATHDGSCWDYLFYKTAPTSATLPVIAVSTTSGTGSQVTQVAVITNSTTRDKSAIYHPNIFPKVSIVDPELMVSLPPAVTRSTGFDVLCHAFESTLHPKCNPLIELMAWDAIERVSTDLPRVLVDGADLEARESMAWADTMAGYCIASAGVTLPHGIGMAIGGMYPRIAHGQSLAIVYPAFCQFTWKCAIPQFARLARTLDRRLEKVADSDAAQQSRIVVESFLRKIDLRLGLTDFDVPEFELEALARQSAVLPDYTNNPRVATPLQMLSLIQDSHPAQL
jgi:alcohol dehydrogenase class IV